MNNSEYELKKTTPCRVAVGLSGGVDSSVAVYLLKKDGYEVVGLHLKCWDYDAPGCTGNEDRRDAIKVASQLGIKFEELDFTAEYKDRVLKYYFDEISAGRTPNPDVMCNIEIKFGLFLEWAKNNDFDAIATGHYARVEKGEGNLHYLLSGADSLKDQSYFLFRLRQQELEYSIFPLGHLTKQRVRSIASEAGLATSGKPDSTGICFIGDIDVREFIKSRIPVRPGRVVDSKGETVGHHEGVELYTIGQRQGFTLTRYFGVPVYVIAKDPKTNTLTVGMSHEARRSEFSVGELSFVGPYENICSLKELKCEIRIRNLGDKMQGLIRGDGDSIYSSAHVVVTLMDEALGVAAGQSAVFYNKDHVLGGGTIV